MKHIKIQKDKGYQDIAKLFPDSETPKKPKAAAEQRG